MANYIMKDEGYKSFRVIYYKGKKVGQVLIMALTDDHPYPRFKARIKGVEYISDLDMKHAFHECISRVNGYNSLAERNADVKRHNSIVREHNKHYRASVKQAKAQLAEEIAVHGKAKAITMAFDRAFEKMGK